MKSNEIKLSNYWFYAVAFYAFYVLFLFKPTFDKMISLFAYGFIYKIYP